MILRLALKEIGNNRRFSLFFSVSIAIGLLGFISLDAVKRSFDSVLLETSQNLLTADLILEARRPLNEQERQTALNVARPVAFTESRNLYSMLQAGSESTLAEIRAIEDQYPFYGWIKLERQGVIESKSSKSITNEPKIWLAKDLLYKLQVKPGDKVQLGYLEFTIDDVIADASSFAFASTGFAPRAYIGLSQLSKTGLVREGSVIWHSLLLKVKPGTNVETLLNTLNQKLPEPGLQIQNHKTQASRSGRILHYLSDYLGLVALSAFFLAAAGAAYLFRSFLMAKQKEIAILLSLGMTHTQTISSLLLQIGLLGLGGGLLACLASLGLLPIVTSFIAELSPMPFTPVLSPMTLLVGCLVGSVGAVLICLPLIDRIRKLRAAEIFQEFSQPQFTFSPSSLAAAMPALLAFFSLSLWQANSLRVGLVFFAGMLAATVILGITTLLFLNGLERLMPHRPLFLKFGVRFLVRNRLNAVATSLAIGLGAILINVIPQVRHTLVEELKTPRGNNLPSFFMFDIQEDQKDQLVNFLASKGLQPDVLSPMIRARLTQLNGNPFRRDNDKEPALREDQEEQRFRNRGVNLTYRATLSDSETILAGRPYQKRYNDEGIAEISLEERYADRLGVGIGDTLTFEIQSVPIQGKVVNLRKIKWNSFQPNFFIQFQEGVLEDAPKTYVASLRPVPDAQKNQLQTELVQAFPNVSIINVSMLVEKMIEMVDKMGMILNIMAWLSFAAGIIVLFFIANHQALSRRWDTNLLKILGTPFWKIRLSVFCEMGILAGYSSLLGAVIGYAFSLVLGEVLFDHLESPDWMLSGLLIVTIISLCLLTAWLAERQVLRQKPALYLRELP